jgi:putative sigma-54 modulation protein
MELDVRGRHLQVSEALRAHLARRLEFALGRVSHRIGVVQVRLEDLNGPRGGVDKRCRIRVAGDHGWRVVVESADGDAYAAVDLAAGRARRAVERALGRAGQ